MKAKEIVGKTVTRVRQRQFTSSHCGRSMVLDAIEFDDGSTLRFVVAEGEGEYGVEPIYPARPIDPDPQTRPRLPYKDVPEGAMFVFASEEDMPLSGLAKGPWIKVSPRCYRHVSTRPQDKHRVGSARAACILLPDTAAMIVAS